MHDDNLIRMANQIGTFFASMPDRKEALEGTASHLRKFWEPRMRRALLARIDAGNCPQLSDFVRQAVQEYREQIEA